MTLDDKLYSAYADGRADERAEMRNLVDSQEFHHICMDYRAAGPDQAGWHFERLRLLITAPVAQPERSV